MQLPRGTFRSIQKGVTLGVLLRELNASLFSGYCMVSAGPVGLTLVLEKGTCILAEYQQLAGDDAWKMIAGMEGTEVDAEICDLSVTQLQLALEFNKSAKIGRSRTPSDFFSSTHKGKKEADVVLGWAALQKPDLNSGYGIPAAPATATATVQELQPNTSDIGVGDIEGYASINRDLEALDAMDLDTMAEKIRVSCKTTVRRLHLGHLIEDE